MKQEPKPRPFSPELLRAVACANALSGIKNPAGVKKCIEALQRIHEYLSGSCELYEHGVMEGDGRGDNVPTCKKVASEALKSLNEP